VNGASPGAELSALLAHRAGRNPGGQALVELFADGSERVTTWSELRIGTTAVASRLRALAATHGDIVACFPGRQVADSIVRALGALLAGVPFFPMPDAAAADHARLVRLVSPLGTPVDPEGTLLTQPEPASPRPPARPDVLLATSGTSGPPNVVAHSFGLARPGRVGFSLLLDSARWSPAARQLVTLPCYHIAPVQSSIRGVIAGNTLVIRDVSDGGLLETAAKHKIDWMLTTPHHMTHALRESGPAPRWLEQVQGVLHTGSWCPPATKRAWLTLVGPHRLFEMYGGTEAPGMTFAEGTTWLERPGTVGRGFFTRVSIRDEDGAELPAGAVGEVYLRTLRPGVALGTHWLRRSADGFISLGDTGWLDDSGCLFLKGRAGQAIEHRDGATWLTELESALAEHPAVADIAVHRLGESDSVRLQVSVAGSNTVSAAQLAHIVRGAARHPIEIDSVEFVPRINRSPMGKTIAR
jgi:bile acid-coenzyme A ligase